MPDPGKPEESGTRADSVAIVAEDAQSLYSFASCPTCPGFWRTPTLHVACAPVDTIPGKDTNADPDKKVPLNDSSSSSSSDQPVENKSAGESSVTCTFPHCKCQRRTLSLEDQSEKVDELAVTDVTPDQDVARVANAEPSSNPGKRKAEADAEDGPVSPAKKKNHKVPAAISKVVKAAHDQAAYDQFWEHHKPVIFEDLPDQPGTSYGRGQCMQTCQSETVSLSNVDAAHVPMDNAMNVIEAPERASTGFQPQFVTLRFAGFALDIHEGGKMLTSFTDEVYESDPEGVGLEGLDILHMLPGVNIADEPSFMEDEQQQF